MKRGILIILNPGDYRDKEHYCAGVYKDKDNYIDFFKSNKGGAWEEDEMVVRDMPDYHTVRKDIMNLDRLDYSMIIFSGHGYTDVRGYTMLELNTVGDECCADELQNSRRTVILDCCRKIYYPHLFEKRATLDEALFEEDMGITHEMARAMYESEIEKSVKAALVLYSCDLNECSHDDSTRGGVYSYELLNKGRKWNGPGTLSIVRAHEQVAQNQKWIRMKQHPQICKPRLTTGHYYPFSLNV